MNTEVRVYRIEIVYSTPKRIFRYVGIFAVFFAAITGSNTRTKCFHTARYHGSVVVRNIDASLVPVLSYQRLSMTSQVFPYFLNSKHLITTLLLHRDARLKLSKTYDSRVHTHYAQCCKIMIAHLADFPNLRAEFA